MWNVYFQRLFLRHIFFQILAVSYIKVAVVINPRFTCWFARWNEQAAGPRALSGGSFL
jgi:hypothetical protein